MVQPICATLTTVIRRLKPQSYSPFHERNSAFLPAGVIKSRISSVTVVTTQDTAYIARNSN